MKKNSLLFIIIISFLFLFTDVNAATNPYNKTFKFNGNDKLNCTWYAWDQVNKKTGIALPKWGNASSWYESAKKAGFEVGQTPKEKSIVVWSWYNSSGKDLGHVGYVERVSGNKIYVWDSDQTCIDENYVPYKECFMNAPDQGAQADCYKLAKKIACEKNASYWSSPGDLIGYIYLDKVPETTTTKKSTKSTTAKEKNTSTTKSAEEIKKEIPYLSHLDIYPGGVKFDKDTFEYEINIYTDVNFIIIGAIAEDSDATVEGDGKLELVKGRNEYKINVKKDDVVNTYTVIVNNSDEFKPVVTVSYSKSSNYPIPIDIIFGVFTGITIFIFSYAIYKRKY